MIATMFAMLGKEALPGLCVILSALCAAIAQQPTTSPRPAYDGSASPSAVKPIYIDQDCRIIAALAVDAAGKTPRTFRDPVICHIEQVADSEHMEEKIVGNNLYRSRIRISEQQYVLQNVAQGRVVFVVQQAVPADWVVDSDPQPSQIVDGIATFPFYAEPGEIVKLHVGLRHVTPLKTKTIKTDPLAPAGTTGN